MRFGRRLEVREVERRFGSPDVKEKLPYEMGNGTSASKLPSTVNSDENDADET